MRSSLLRSAAAGLVALLGSCTTAAQSTAPHAAAPRPTLDYAIGADLSFLAQAEAGGTTFKDAGVVKPGLQLFRDHGYNWIRLRLFHSPVNSPWPLPNDLAYTMALARQAKALGYKFLLNFHYSDTWADPQKQTLPKAWENMTPAQLVSAVHDYTRETISALRAGGAMPDMVQIGNEITPGMLWPRGKLPEHWDTFGALVQAGIRGVDDGRGDAARPLIMIHIDKGGDQAATKWFFDNLLRQGVEFDVIGQSYYPWWHGSLLELRNNLAFMAETYRKDIVLVEVAYNWRPSEYVGQPAPYPESPDGQRQFLEDVHQAVLATPYGLGKGIMWWEPAVAAGALRSRGMFDDAGNALPVANVFDKYTRGRTPQP